MAQEHISRSRAWCFTLNNFTPEELAEIENKSDYGIIGDEIGEKGTRHLQGYLYWKNPRKFTFIKKIIPRAHIEPAKGNPQQNITYCSKDKIIATWGEPPKQGKRTDLETMREILKEPEPMRKITESLNYQATRSAEKWLCYNERKRDWKPEVTWYTGPSGTGKTRAAKEELPEAYWKSGTNKWWDGYDGHKEVIIDDFRGSSIAFTDLLRLLDRYPMQVECKGGSRQFLAEKISITSIYHPEKVYKNLEEEPIEQLLRRIDKIVNLTDTDV
ncbi:replication-associated protein [Odonata-associated circular virus-20]|uniref:Replication-associated protein n=1 Tax=Odonata-associated circular virus-20 TaxID=1592121 RepID=A0A0B4UFV4_9VIRU|nr:replication-associated protein [Odonata-associated circular virus-20]